MFRKQFINRNDWVEKIRKDFISMTNRARRKAPTSASTRILPEITDELAFAEGMSRTWCFHHDQRGVLSSSGKNCRASPRPGSGDDNGYGISTVPGRPS